MGNISEKCRTSDPVERVPGIAEAPFWSSGNLAVRIQNGQRSPDDSGTYFGLMLS